MSDLSLRNVLLVGSERARIDEARRALGGVGGFGTAAVPNLEAALASLGGGPPVCALVADATTLERAPPQTISAVRELYSGVAFVAVGRPSPTSRLTMPLVPAEAVAASLRGEVEHATALRRLVTVPAVTVLVGDLDELPSAPEAYWQLMEAVAAGADAEALGAIVQRDPAMTLKVLRLVNSAFFGLSRRISSVSQAVALLGTGLLKGLVLTAHVFSALEGRPARGFSPEKFQQYSLRVARLAQQFGRPLGLADDAFTAAVLLDVGSLVLAVKWPDLFEEVHRTALETGESVLAVERRVLGATHAQIGARVLSVWGLPDPLLDCVALHHEPESGHLARRLTALVHAADALLGIACCGEPEETLKRGLVSDAGLGEYLGGWQLLASEAAAN